MEHKIKLKEGQYLDRANPDLNLAEYYSSDGAKLRELLEEDGYTIVEPRAPQGNDIIIKNDGGMKYSVGPDGFVYAFIDVDLRQS